MGLTNRVRYRKRSKSSCELVHVESVGRVGVEVAEGRFELFQLGWSELEKQDDQPENQASANELEKEQKEEDEDSHS